MSRPPTSSAELRRVKMLIDAFAANPDAAEFHEIDVDASPDVVYRALLTADFSRAPIVRALLGLRSLPARLLGATRPRTASLTLDEIARAGFGRLAEKPGEEIVLGVCGRFWRPIANVEPFRREAFSGPVPRGMARAVWSFRVVPRGRDGATLSTETRVICGDPSSRLKFRAYWMLVRPFSGAIRIVMLKSVKRAAESRAA